nr:hypothetical protein CFP56_56556 [Quercus suber]
MPPRPRLQPNHTMFAYPTIHQLVTKQCQILPSVIEAFSLPEPGEIVVSEEDELRYAQLRAKSRAGNDVMESEVDGSVIGVRRSVTNGKSDWFYLLVVADKTSTSSSAGVGKFDDVSVTRIIHNGFTWKHIPIHWRHYTGVSLLWRQAFWAIIGGRLRKITKLRTNFEWNGLTEMYTDQVGRQSHYCDSEECRVCKLEKGEITD